MRRNSVSLFLFLLLSIFYCLHKIRPFFLQEKEIEKLKKRERHVESLYNRIFMMSNESLFLSRHILYGFFFLCGIYIYLSCSLSQFFAAGII